jgi:uncharacterized membrane protein YtjA (UPF0391 family)
LIGQEEARSVIYLYVSLLPSGNSLTHIELLQRNSGRSMMIRWSILFLIVAIIAALLGFTNVAGTAVEAAQILFFVFLVIFVVSVVFERRGSTRDLM